MWNAFQIVGGLLLQKHWFPTWKFWVIMLGNAFATWHCFLYLQLHPWFTWCNALLPYTLHTSIMAIEIISFITILLQENKKNHKVFVDMNFNISKQENPNNTIEQIFTSINMKWLQHSWQPWRSLIQRTTWNL